jgi:succinoglycan biosynthesis transport protein ExoP
MANAKSADDFPLSNAHGVQNEKQNSFAVSTYINPESYLPQGEDAINLREYWHVIAKRKWTVISLLSMVILVTLVATLLTTPIYRGTTLIQIEREAAKVVDFKDVEANDSSGADFYQTQYELLKSKSLALRVVDQLGLDRLKQSQPKKDQGIAEWLAKLQGDAVRSTPNNLNPSNTNPGNANPSDALRSNQASALLTSLTVEPVRNSRLVRVSFDSPQPEMAAKVANAIAQNFISVNMERRFDANSYAKTFLEERIAQVKAKLESAEKSMLEYARDNEIYSLGKEGGTTASRDVEDFSIALNAAQQERIKAESLYRQLMTTYAGELPQVLESPIIQSLRESKVKLESEYQDKLSTFQPNYPSMLELAARIEQINVQINKERKVVASSIKATYEASKANEDLIKEKFNLSKNKMLDEQSLGIQYNILKRESDTNRELYDGLLQRLKEVGVTGGVGTNNISVVDQAEVPKSKFKPNLDKNLLIALLIGLVAGIGLAFLFEHLDDTFKQAITVETELGLSVIGLIPDSVEMREGGNIIQLSVDNSRAAIVEAYRSVRTALQLSGEDGAPRVIAMTSAEKGEAKTTSSVAIGTQFAQFGSKVLIIDADLRNPSLHKVIGGDNLIGLTNILTGGESPAKLTRSTAVSNLYYLPSGPLPPNPSELLSSKKMLQLLELAREKFDYVIIDGPPILGLADVLVIANLVDSIILAIHAGTTRRATVQAALKRLQAVRVRPLGVILTRMRHGIHGYGYNYDYYYSYGDGDQAQSQPDTLASK